MRIVSAAFAPVAFFALTALAMSAPAQEGATVTFENRAGSECLVHLSGPSGRFVSVPDKTSRAVAVSPGRYYIVTRYGEHGQFLYARGAAFVVRDDAGGYSAITITLHKVVGGNYRSSPASKAEFEGAK